MSAGSINLDSLAAQLQGALRLLNQLEAAMDRHELFLTAPRPEDLRRWLQQLCSASRWVFDVYEEIDDEIAELERGQSNARPDNGEESTQ